MESMIKCEMCGGLFRSITWTHLKYWHGDMTIYDYQARFPNAPLNSKEVLDLRSSGIRNSYNFETRSRAMVKGWKDYSEEGRKERLRHGMLSKDAKEKNRGSHREMFSKMTPEEKQEWVKRSCGSEEGISKRTESIRKFHSNMSGRERLRWVEQSFLSGKPRENWRRWWEGLSPEDKEKFLRRSFLSDEAVLKASLSNRTSPSVPELFTGYWLGLNHPGEWAYTGDRKNIALLRSRGYAGMKCPDFINIDGKKVVIEILGGLGYWHTEEEEDSKIAYYEKQGFSCLVLLEEDCYDYEKLKAKYNKLGGIAI